MQDTGLSARAAGASSSSAPYAGTTSAAAVDEDDESKTRKAHLGYARLRCSHRAAVSLLLLLTVAVAAFLAGRARSAVECAPPRLDARFLSLPDAAAASDFGFLGVPWCKPSRSCCWLLLPSYLTELDPCFGQVTDSYMPN
ncbi:hypothetical protein PR202_ga27278 [Eleusine coracana subsp. coracana]|uniref:Uncharacterized protein n=1 Tax=Eleusine coracana subsp. coracana TaxID=191504 RepID=A0AAV5DGQ1_ELECO|nr:hypothetical protein PR202_ga27278 [Eleusine coracana subsp. coracana]